MATVTGYTAQRMKKIEDKTVVDGTVVADKLILVTRDGTQIDAGSVRGPQGVPGPPAPGSAIPYDGGTGLSATNVEEALDELATEKVDRTEVIGVATALVPPGSIIVWAGVTVVPTGWLLCDGQAVSRTDYAALFAAISNTYGNGDGVATFNLPNLRSRVPVGFDQGDTGFNQIGKIGGEKAHVLNGNEMTPHSHGVNDPGHWHGTGETPSSLFQGPHGLGEGLNTVIDRTSDGWTGISIQSAGGGLAHNNIQPYITMRYLIKA